MLYTIYGKPKVGKTTFALTGAPAKRTAVINADQGLAGIDTAGMTLINDVSSEKLNRTVMVSSFLKNHDRIVIDTATQLYDEMLIELAGGRTPSLNVRGTANNAFAQLLRFLREEGKEVIVLCQERMVLPTEDWAPTDDDEDITASVTADLPQGALKTLTTMSDVIGRLYIAYNDARPVRRLWLTPTPAIVAGARSQKYSGKPPYLPKPSVARLNKLLGW